MKSMIGFFCLVIGFAAPCRSFAKTTVGLDVAVGGFSNYGLVGAGVRFFPNEDWDVRLTVGVDTVGLVTGLGMSRYFGGGSAKCFFVFDCESRFYANLTALRAPGGKVTVTEEGISGDYEQSAGYAGSAMLGMYDVYKSGFAMGFEVGCRYWLKKPDAEFISGTQSAKQLDALKVAEGSVGAAVTVGWAF